VELVDETHVVEQARPVVLSVEMLPGYNPQALRAGSRRWVHPHSQLQHDACRDRPGGIFVQQQGTDGHRGLDHDSGSGAAETAAYLSVTTGTQKSVHRSSRRERVSCLTKPGTSSSDGDETHRCIRLQLRRQHGDTVRCERLRMPAVPNGRGSQQHVYVLDPGQTDAG
jgi:hypothetical protein